MDRSAHGNRAKETRNLRDNLKGERVLLASSPSRERSKRRPTRVTAGLKRALTPLDRPHEDCDGSGRRELIAPARVSSSSPTRRLLFQRLASNGGRHTAVRCNGEEEQGCLARNREAEMRHAIGRFACSGGVFRVLGQRERN